MANLEDGGQNGDEGDIRRVPCVIGLWEDKHIVWAKEGERLSRQGKGRSRSLVLRVTVCVVCVCV